MSKEKKTRKVKKAKPEKSVQTTEAEQYPLSAIVKALGFLKDQAVRDELDDAAAVIEAAFKICLSMYYLDLRGEYVGKNNSFN